MRQFVEIMKSLYVDSKVDREKVIELYKGNKITEDEKNYILDTNKVL